MNQRSGAVAALLTLVGISQVPQTANACSAKEAKQELSRRSTCEVLGADSATPSGEDCGCGGGNCGCGNNGGCK